MPKLIRSALYLALHAAGGRHQSLLPGYAGCPKRGPHWPSSHDQHHNDISAPSSMLVPRSRSWRRPIGVRLQHGVGRRYQGEASSDSLDRGICTPPLPCGCCQPISLSISAVPSTLPAVDAGSAGAQLLPEVVLFETSLTLTCTPGPRGQRHLARCLRLFPRGHCRDYEPSPFLFDVVGPSADIVGFMA